MERALAVYKEEFFSSPLPHPRHLEAYEKIHPGAADRIIAMAEQALSHNIAIAGRTLDEDASYRKLGMWLGFSALALLIAGAVICGLAGRAELAGGFLAAGAIGVVGRFIHGRGGRDSN